MTVRPSPRMKGRVQTDDIGLGSLLGGMPPERGAGEVVGDPLVVVDGDLDVLAVLAELGFEPARATGTCVAQVGLDGKEELASLPALGAVLRDGDVEPKHASPLRSPSEQVRRSYRLIGAEKKQASIDIDRPVHGSGIA
ncbi:hypothetical protein CFC21_064511 [Triticum aestivum]|uniref:Uncharacterized protein n=3 Tax=Triticum TaxID=4564 RepID=A0A9R0THN4_TRITD|nr:hypothetical protein CFC21_064511 [Triticum aestivum]VAI13733.1 unnamed protein product [Triticum turgidum subsp. durum]